jgi:hypothetical protein
MMFCSIKIARETLTCEVFVLFEISMAKTFLMILSPKNKLHLNERFKPPASQTNVILIPFKSIFEQQTNKVIVNCCLNNRKNAIRHQKLRVS